MFYPRDDVRVPAVHNLIQVQAYDIDSWWVQINQFSAITTTDGCESRLVASPVSLSPSDVSASDKQEQKTQKNKNDLLFSLWRWRAWA